MDHPDWIRDILKMGFHESQCPQHDMTQFLGIIQRCAELPPRTSEMSQICNDLVRIIIEETNFENCSIVLWNSERQSLCLSAAFGLEDLLGGQIRQNYHRDLTFAKGEGIAGQVYHSRSPIFLENVSPESVPRIKGAVVQPAALACLPLLDIGVLNISGRRSHSFSPQTRRNWEMVSRVIGHLLLGIYFRDRGNMDVGPRGENGVAHAKAPLPDPAQAPVPFPFSKLALERMPQGVCILDGYGLVTEINRSIENLQGETAREIVGRSPAVLFRDPIDFDALLERVKTTGQEELSDVHLVNAHGEVYLADVHLVRLGDNGLDTAGYLLVVNDTTKKKAFAEKLLQTEKLAALGTMAGGVAHDFNNLLMAILGNVQLVLPLLQDEELRRRLLNVEKAVHDGAHTVRRLQKFTERDREPQSQLAAVDVNEAIKDVVELTRPRWKDMLQRHGHSAEFQMDLEPQCMAAIHASDFREVLTNLIFNALEAMPEGGTITLKSVCLKDKVMVQVGDTGIGMTEEVMSKIFDPYYTTKGVGNSGLGLSVSWSLVVRAGGEFHVKSKPGRGSIFAIKLPRSTTLRNEADADSSCKNPSSRRLLIVEDDAEVLGILHDMLLLKGHEVVAMQEGEKALDLIDREYFDLVLTDLGMPIVSGWEIARRVKARNPHTPVILITGWGVQYEEEDLSKRCVDSVLPKPLSWDKLLLAIENLL